MEPHKTGDEAFHPFHPLNFLDIESVKECEGVMADESTAD